MLMLMLVLDCHSIVTGSLILPFHSLLLVLLVPKFPFGNALLKSSALNGQLAPSASVFVTHAHARIE